MAHLALKRGLIFYVTDTSVEWDIYDFLSSKMIESPVFEFESIELCLGVVVDEEDNRLEVYVRKIRNNTPHQFSAKLQMGTGHGAKLEWRRGSLKESGIFRVYRWMPWTELLERRLEILSDGSLAVMCELGTLNNTVWIPRRILAPSSPPHSDVSTASDHSDEEPENETQVGEENGATARDSDEEDTTDLPKSFRKLQKALRTLFLSGEDSDVTIKVQGKEFPAHRGILRVRSPVFDSMFSHDMVEKETGIVAIDDCDPEIFPDFLRHIYTGSTKHINDKNVFALYAASDKYAMDELKDECLVYIRCNLTVRTFVDTITLALRYGERGLVKLATEFFCDHSSRITDTVQWHAFLAEHTIEGNELFRKALRKTGKS